MFSFADALILPANFGPANIFGQDLDTGIVIAALNVLIAVFAGASFGARGMKEEAMVRRVTGWGLKILIGVLALSVSVLGVTDAAEAEREEQRTREYQKTVTAALADLMLHSTNTADLGDGTKSIDAIVDRLPADVREEIIREQPVLAVAVPKLNEVPADANSNTNANDGRPSQSGGASNAGLNDLSNRNSNSGNANANSNANMNDANARLQLTETELAALRWLQGQDKKLYLEVVKDLRTSRRMPDDVIAKYKQYVAANPQNSASLGDRLRSNASDAALSDPRGAADAANPNGNGTNGNGTDDGPEDASDNSERGIGRGLGEGIGD